MTAVITVIDIINKNDILHESFYNMTKTLKYVIYNWPFTWKFVKWEIITMRFIFFLLLSETSDKVPEKL